MGISDKDRLDALQQNQWEIKIDMKYVYVGPICLQGKPWGVSTRGDIRAAIDDAIVATQYETEAARRAREPKKELTRSDIYCPEAGA